MSGGEGPGGDDAADGGDGPTDVPDDVEDVEKTVTPEGPTVSPGEDREVASFVEYGIDDRPPLGESIFLGFQHYLTMIGATVAIPLVLATLMGMPGPQTARLIGTFFVVSGIATLAQTTIGNRYPIVQGGTFSMLAPAIAIITVLGASDAGWQVMILELQGAVIVAGLVEVLIGYFGVMGFLKRYMGPIVIAPVIALIGLALFNVPQITAATNDFWLLGLTLGLILLFSLYLDTSHRAFQLFPVLLGVVTAWAIALVLSLVGVYSSSSPGYVPYEQVAAAPAVLPIYPLQWGMPEVSLPLVVGMFAGVAASMVESFGDYHAVARLSGQGAPSERRINHGIGMEGVMNVVSASFGGCGCTSYSENIGAIGLTGVASRYVVQIGAVLMLFVGFVGYFGQAVATIPNPIVGGLFLAMFGQIVAVGISNLKYVDLDSSRNVFIVGLALFAGNVFGVPASTSMTAVGAIAGLGVATGVVLVVIVGLLTRMWIVSHLLERGEETSLSASLMCPPTRTR